MERSIAITRTDISARELLFIAKRTRDCCIVRRLLAIAVVLECVDRQALRDWVHRYNCGGIAELSDRRGKGAKPRLSPTQQARFVAWVEAGPNPIEDGVVQWRCADLQAHVEDAFSVKLHERTIDKYLAKHGFCRFSVRPEHPKTDPAAQQAFKKLCQPRSRAHAGTCKG